MDQPAREPAMTKAAAPADVKILVAAQSAAALLARSAWYLNPRLYHIQRKVFADRIRRRAGAPEVV